MNRYFPVQQGLFTARTVRRLLPAFFLTGVLLFVGVEGRGQHSITGVGTYTQDFNGFEGTLETVPPNWAWTSSAPYSGNYFVPNTYNGTNGTFALRRSIVPSDGAFGGKFGMGENTLIFTARNNITQSTPITGFIVSWNVEQYSQCTDTTMIEFAYSVGPEGSPFTVIESALVKTSTTDNPDLCDNLSGITSTPSGMIPLITNVVNGQDIRFRFRFVNSGSNNAHVGIDDFNLQAIVPPPAPSVTHTGEVVVGSEISIGSTNNQVYRVKLDVTNGPITLTRLNITSGGTWTNADIENFKLYHNTNPNLQGSTSLNTVSTLTGGTQVITFSGFTRSIPNGTSYLLITSDVSEECDSDGKTVSAQPTMNADFTYQQSNISINMSSTFSPASLHTIKAKGVLSVENSGGQTINCGAPLNAGTLSLGFDTVLTVRIRNIGCGDLELSSIMLGNVGDYFVHGFSSTTLAPDEFYDLEILFNPQSTGERSTSVPIMSDGGNCSLVINGVGRSSPDPIFSEVVTPNDDGHNDVFAIVFPSTSIGSSFELEVFNRAGGMVKTMDGTVTESLSPQLIWDVEGCPDGVYYYRLSLNEAVFRGAVTVIGRK